MKIKKRKPQPAKKIGGQTDLAKLMNCSQPAVSQMVSKGVVKVRKDGKIDLAQAKVDWNAHVSPATTFGKRKNTETQTEKAIKGKDSERFYKARADREEAEASMAQMEMRQLEGELLRADEVRRDTIATARLVRDRLRQIPKRLAPMLVGMTERQMTLKLADEIDQALVVLAEEVREGTTDET